jgi:hypothetical protein
MRLRTGVIVPLALLALAATASAWAVSAGSAGALKANVQIVKESFYISNNTVRDGIAKCPAGTKVFSGGFASTGQQAKVFVAGPARNPNGYIVYAVTPPVNISAGVTKETATITIVAYCAPVGQPIVFG